MRVFPAWRRVRALLQSDPVAEAAAAASRPNTIFGRRDVAVTPWTSICAVSVAIVISTLLKESGGHRDQVILGLAGGGTLLTAFLARMQYWRLGLLLRNSVGIYLVGCASMFASLVFFGLRGEGVTTPFFMAAVPTAGYIGLVIPDPWRRAGLGVMVVGTLGLQLIGERSGVPELLLVLALIAAGWWVGVLGSQAHARAAQTAEALARYDHLAGTLSRRGFLEQARWHLQSGTRAAPVAVLMLDLDEFKRVNDAEGHAAGDALLTWVGRTLPLVVPEDAEVGRLGGDEFAVLLPGVGLERAADVAYAIRARLSERIVVSIGIAMCTARPVTVEAVLRAGDEALYVCKSDRELGVHAIAVYPDLRRADGPAPTPPARALSSAAVHRSGQAPAMPDAGVVFGWMMARGLLTMAACGSIVVARASFGGGDAVSDEFVRFGGVPLLLSFVLLAWLSRGRGHLEGWRYSLVVPLSGMLLGAGVTAAMLADGGLTSPIVAALYLRVFFEAAILPRRQALAGSAVTLGWWLVAALLGPADALWIAPFQLTVLASSFALGSLGHRAFSDLTSRSLQLAHTDLVTGARNRLGFDAAIQATLDVARATDTSFALLALDLDDFKVVNDTRGHPAGDALLRQVAALLVESLPANATVCRIGGDEFAAIVPGWRTASAEPLADRLAAALAPLARASVGHAVCPYDGGNADRLMQAADARAYALKRHRAGERLRAVPLAHVDVA